jgi:hypothetical protein
LVYQEVSVGPSSIAAALPLETKTPWYIQSINIDFTLTAREFDSRRGEGLVSFLAYTGSLILLLVSLRFLFGAGSWPLANLFLGALSFRFVLSFMVFLESREVNVFLLAFANKRIPDFLVTPVVFGITGALILVYSILAYLARQDSKTNG